MSDLLKEYSVEIHGEGREDAMTLEQLISSHRHLRQLNVDTHAYRLQARDEGYAYGVKQGMARVNNEYIKVEDLKKLTMAQVAEMLYDGDND
jgi:hypothetical protein